MTTQKQKLSNSAIVATIRIVIIVIILGLGLAGNQMLASMKEEPKESIRPEAIARVNGIVGKRQNFQTTLRGYGTAESNRVTEISPQVTGRVIKVHPDLEVGMIIPEGEVFFEIDPTDYEIALERAKADLGSAEANLQQIRTQNESDLLQLKVTERMTELAENEFKRFEELVAQNQAESMSAQERAELSLVREREKLITMKNRINQFDNDLAVAQANIRVMQSRLRSAEQDFDRTTLRAPYDARIVSKTVELGKLASMGQAMLTVADDSILEIPVSIDGGEVSSWLDLKRAELQPQWFDRFTDYPVEVIWTSAAQDIKFNGSLDRVAQFDTRNRTFNLISQVRNDKQAEFIQNQFPLANGMFCEVFIPGKIAENVIPIPRDAIDSQGLVMISNDGLLESRKVDVVRIQDDTVLIASGIEDGEIILTRRPPNPIEGMKLDVTLMGDSVFSDKPAESLTMTGAADEELEAGI